MGQRHQLFVIAKIGARYRNLAAVHHQWLYGATALKRCHRLVQIFQAAENRIPIRQELVSALYRDEEAWKDDRSDGRRKALMPFPMIITCLILGASFDPTDGYFHRVQIEPFGMEYDEGDNNNGITVIDISDLFNVRYCFVDILPWGMESNTPVSRMTPLSASTYLWSYYNRNDKGDQEEFGQVIDKLEKWDLVDAAALRDTWPTGEWRDHGKVGDFEEEEEEPSGEEEAFGEEKTSQTEEDSANRVEAGGNHSLNRQIGLSTRLVTDPSNFLSDQEEPLVSKMTSLSTKDTAETSGNQAAKQSAAGSNTLRDSAMNTMIEAALGQSETELKDLMPQAEQLPDFLPSLKHKLYEDPSVLKTSPSGFYLLCRALEGEYEVDLSPLKEISIKDIGMVVSKLRECGNMKTVVLSNMPNLRKEDLRVISGGKISLRGLCLFETPLISANSVVSFVNEYVGDLQDLYHTELLRRPWSLSFKKWQSENEINFSANPVNQMIWVTSGVSQLSKTGLRLENDSIDWKKVLEQEHSKEIFPYLTYGAFPLNDILLPPVKFVTGLLNFLNWSAKNDGFRQDAHEHAIAAANSFAMVRSSIRGSDYQVGPLPSALYIAGNKYRPRNWPIPMSALTPGKWTIVVIHEALTSLEAERHPNLSAKIRYAMITITDTPTQDLVVADMSTFLDQVTNARNQTGTDPNELHDCWTVQSESILPGGGKVELCEEQEVRDLLQTVFSETNQEHSTRDLEAKFRHLDSD